MTGCEYFTSSLGSTFLEDGPPSLLLPVMPDSFSRSLNFLNVSDPICSSKRNLSERRALLCRPPRLLLHPEL